MNLKDLGAVTLFKVEIETNTSDIGFYNKCDSCENTYGTMQGEQLIILEIPVDIFDKIKRYNIEKAQQNIALAKEKLRELGVETDE